MFISECNLACGTPRRRRRSPDGADFSNPSVIGPRVAARVPPTPSGLDQSTPAAASSAHEATNEKQASALQPSKLMRPLFMSPPKGAFPDGSVVPAQVLQVGLRMLLQTLMSNPKP